MKNIFKVIITSVFVFLLFFCQAQEIQKLNNIPTTLVRYQANTQTCWSFATISFLESELLRMKKGEFNLSEMYIVRMIYPIKAETYYRHQGNVNFGPGGQAHDVMIVLDKFGVVPESKYSGLKGNEKIPNHSSLDANISKVVKSMPEECDSSEYNKWIKSVNDILNQYLGDLPDDFNYSGKKYNPKTYSEAIGLNADNYVEISSYYHHPYYSQFVLEVPDNWSGGEYYNVPLSDFVSIIDTALSRGYTVTWDGDISASGFSNNGYAFIKDDFTKVVTDSVRQQAFDDFEVTDDHLMHLVGSGVDTSGRKYYYIKNSWGFNSGLKGYWWMSENYYKLNTIAILLHKDALPADVANKLGIVQTNK